MKSKESIIIKTYKKAMFKRVCQTIGNIKEHRISKRNYLRKSLGKILYVKQPLQKKQHSTLPKTTAQLIFGSEMMSQTLIIWLTENITNKRKQSLINNQRESY